ncbi:hypothetical protein CPC08DRAFT_516463 [Agrocybe pediades]|nr:hypothetical protein CPC08DRAFT_516463 [Agrocybe pediades]
MAAALADLLRKKLEKELERKAIDNEIVRIQLEYSSLANRTSKILSLPLEVTAAIFHLLSWERNQFSPPDPIETVSRVCKSWRTLALSRPEYWDAFFSEGENHSQVDRLLAYLERSKDRPFDFDVSVGRRYPTVTEKLLEVAVEHMHRWRRFSFICEANMMWQGTESIKKLHAISAPGLESIQISIDSLINSAETVRQTKFLRGQAEKLTTLYLDATWFADASWLQGFPSVKNIQIHNNGGLASYLSPKLPTETLTRLFECPNLESLSAAGLLIEKFVTFPIIKTKASKLKYLRCSDESMLEFVLHSVDAPKLELFIVQRQSFGNSLRITEHDDESPLFPSLHTLAFTDCSIDPGWAMDGAEVFYHFTLATNNAKHVYVTSNRPTNMEDRMFSDMAYQFTENGTIFYPNMERLYCEFDRDPGEVPDYTHYAVIFKSRTESLKKHCTLHLNDVEAAFFEGSDPESWKIMEDGGYYRGLGRQYPDGIDLVPWPPRAVRYEEDGWLCLSELRSLSVDAMDPLDGQHVEE